MKLVFVNSNTKMLSPVKSFYTEGSRLHKFKVKVATHYISRSSIKEGQVQGNVCVWTKLDKGWYREEWTQKDSKCYGI